jgi:MerR family redox-sensitive transcriptional activator SoxR
MGANALVPIGELARRTGVATSALRYYERIGLLPLADRLGQRRQYPPVCVERVALIRLYQDAGFTLTEIGRLLAATSRGRPAWNHLAERKVAELDARIADAQRAKKLIKHALACEHRDLLACPNFRAALEAQLEPRR